MAHLWLAGVSLREIAERTHYHPHTIATVVRSMGLPKRNPGAKSRFSDDEIAGMRELRRAGRSYAQIAVEFGISRSTARYYTQEVTRDEGL